MSNRRLAYIAQLVRPGSRVADVGTDHAFLPVMLVQSGRCPCAIATDIRQGPLGRAQETVRAAGLESRIAVRLGDGLAPVLPDEVDDIVIAGMGGETIAAILTAAPWVKQPGYQLVLQPMSRAEELRRYLLTNGFEIAEESSLADGTHLYTVLTVRYTEVAPVTDPVAYYMGALCWERDGVYLEKVCARLHTQAEGLFHTDKEKAETLFALENAIRNRRETT